MTVKERELGEGGGVKALIVDIGKVLYDVDLGREFASTFGGG